MLSYAIKALSNFFFTEHASDDIENNASDAVNNSPNCIDGKNKFSFEEFVETDTDVSPVSGKITHLSDEYGLVNNELYFESKILPKNEDFKVGDSVYCTLYKARDNEAYTVIKVKRDISGSAEQSNKPKCNNDNLERRNVAKGCGSLDPSMVTHERVLYGKIDTVNGSKITIHPINVICDVNEVNVHFSPVKGDWVSVTVDMLVDKDSADLTGDILHIKSIKPLLVRDGKGVVTIVKDVDSPKFKGVIENEILFKRQFCDINFNVAIGSEVIFSAIESDQGKYRWRAVSVKNAYDTHTNSSNKDEVHENYTLAIKGNTKIDPIELNQTKDINLEVKNVSKKTIKLCTCFFSLSKSKSQMSLVSPIVNGAKTIEPNESLKFVFRCEAKFVGLSTEIFIFSFENFNVTKKFNINVTPGDDMLNLIGNDENEGDYKNEKVTYTLKNFDYSNALCGPKMSTYSKFPVHGRRDFKKKYLIPQELFKIVLEENRGKNNLNRALENYAPYIKEELTSLNYMSRYHFFVYMEEIYERIAFKKFDLKDVVFRRKDGLLTLNLSNVQEKDQLLKIGLTVFATQPWSEANNIQKGYVKYTYGDDIYIGFHESFCESYDQSACDVSFQATRVTHLRKHYAIDMGYAHLGPLWLFPDEVKEKKPRIEFVDEADSIPNKDIVETTNNKDIRTVKIKWYQNLNELQKAAVKNVLQGKGRPLPYVIFGPPGTGKTLTIVEVILQLFRLFSDSRILVGTPSNSAADIICHHLVETGKLTPGEMVRLISLSRTVSCDIPENILPYCSHVIDDSVISYPFYSNPTSIRMCKVSDSVGMQRIIVGTCVMIGALQSSLVCEGAFTHIIIDESGQATEPEALIPISFMNNKRGQVILSGDTEQLGPCCQAVVVQKYGLGKGFLDRICQLPPYRKDMSKFPKTRGYDPRCITRLRVNYRSVPEILALPNKMFYDSELIATVSQTNSVEADIIQKLDIEIPGRSNPPAIVFHGVRGKCMKPNNSSSWYNPLEIWQVACYLKKIYNIGLTSENVGIVTPYRKQVEKLRYVLSELDLEIPKIGSVEEFQGQERYVIILSTVRSTFYKDLSQLGFLASPRRVNVSVTRARAILIIIGNPITLCKNPYWANVVRYCCSINSYTGCPLQDIPDENT